MVFKKVKLFVLNKVIEYGINNIKENVVVCVCGKIGLNHLIISIILFVI
jgi:hypothetical protein